MLGIRVAQGRPESLTMSLFAPCPETSTISVFAPPHQSHDNNGPTTEVPSGSRNNNSELQTGAMESAHARSCGCEHEDLENNYF